VCNLLTLRSQPLLIDMAAFSLLQHFAIKHPNQHAVSICLILDFLVVFLLSRCAQRIERHLAKKAATLQKLVVRLDNYGERKLAQENLDKELEKARQHEELSRAQRDEELATKRSTKRSSSFFKKSSKNVGKGNKNSKNAPGGAHINKSVVQPDKKR